MNNSFINGIWYPGSDYVEFVVASLVPILFPNYEILEPDFQYLGGEQGRGLLGSSLARPMPYFGAERYPTLADKASALIWSITLNHPFNDGNKRAALTTSFAFLANNGYALIAHQDEAVELCLRIAANTPGYTESYISRWLEQHLIRIEEIGEILSASNETGSGLDNSVIDRMAQIPNEYHRAWIEFYGFITSNWGID